MVSLEEKILHVLFLSLSLLPPGVSASRFLFPSGRTEIYLSLCTDASSALRYLVKTGTRSIQNIEGWKLVTFPGSPSPTPSRTTVKQRRVDSRAVDTCF